MDVSSPVTPAREKTGKAQKTQSKPLWLLLPALTMLLLVNIYPTLYSFYMSLGKLKGGEYIFVGLKNFERIFNESDFYESLGRTFAFTAFYLILCISLGILLALLFNRRSRFTPIYMVCIFLPMVVSEVVGGTMWNWMFQQSFGIIQVVLNPFLNDQSLISRPWGAMSIVIIASVWKNLAFPSLLILGGLQTISKEIYESAALDGASPWQSFWGITMPLLKPSLLVATLLTTIRGINSLGLILATTKGGPGEFTTTAAVYLYRIGWSYGEFGVAASVSVILFCINIILAVLYIRMLRSK